MLIVKGTEHMEERFPFDKGEEVKFLEDIIGRAWKTGKQDRGINVSDEANLILDFLRRLGYVKLEGR